MPILQPLLVHQIAMQIRLRTQIVIYGIRIEGRFRLTEGIVIFLVEEIAVFPQFLAHVFFQNCLQIIAFFSLSPVVIQAIANITSEEFVGAFASEDYGDASILYAL